jgi:LacI family transcriptional regulator
LLRKRFRRRSGYQSCGAAACFFRVELSAIAPITIRQVARLSGVSVATVSRVFNGYADVHPDTRARVLAAAEELDYAPSAAARTLVGRRSQLIGVILRTGAHADIEHPFFQDVLVGLKHGIGALGSDLLLFATEERAYLRRARHHRVDGVVLWGVDRADPEIPKLLDAAMPLVAVDLEVVGAHATWVSSDNVGGARLAVRHLHDLGHTRIATITGLVRTKPGDERLEGYRSEMASLGLAMRPDYERGGDFYADSGAGAMRALLALPEPPTAVFAASDEMALGAIGAARSAGVRVPKVISVVGFDDSRLASLVQPPLTTVSQDRVGLGEAAARALAGMIEHPDEAPAPTVLPVKLVVRGTSARV